MQDMLTALTMSRLAPFLVNIKTIFLYPFFVAIITAVDPS